MARSVAPPSKVRSKPPLSGRDAAVGVQVDRARRAAGRRARRRPRGRRRGWRCARCRCQVREAAGAEDRQAVAADLELVHRDRRAGGSAASAKRSMRVPSACATFGSAAQTPVARPSTLTVTLRARRVVEVLREAAEPERHVLHLDVGGLQPVEDDEPVPAAARRRSGRAARRTGASSARPAPAARPAGRRGSPRVPVSARLRRKPSLPVSRLPSRSSTAPATASSDDAHAARRLLDALDPHRAVAGEEVAVRRAGSAATARRVKSTSKPRPVVAGARARPARRRCAAAPASSANGHVDVVERPRALGGQVDRRACPRSSAASRRRRPRGSCRSRSTSSWRGLVREARREREGAAGAVEALDVEVRCRGCRRARSSEPREREVRRLAEDRLGRR